jgi:hypothetical protein
MASAVEPLESSSAALLMDVCAAQNCSAERNAVSSPRVALNDLIELRFMMVLMLLMPGISFAG